MDELPKPGDRIVHTIFHAGTVKAIGRFGSKDPTIHIEFDRYGLKILHWSFCRGKLSVEPVPLKGD